MTFTQRFDATLAEFARHGVHAASSMRLLALIRLHGPRNMAFFCDHLRLTSAALTSIVDRLSEQGLIRRDRQPIDRRAYFLTLTETGEELLNRIETMP